MKSALYLAIVWAPMVGIAGTDFPIALLPRTSLGENFIDEISAEEDSGEEDSSDGENLEIEYPSIRIIEVLLSARGSSSDGSAEPVETSEDTTSSALTSEEDRATEADQHSSPEYNQKIYDSFPRSTQNNVELLRRKLLFVFEGRQASQDQFERAKSITFWLKNLNPILADDTLRTAVVEDWSYLIPQLLNIIPHTPNIEIFRLAILKGYFHIANQFLDNQAFLAKLIHSSISGSELFFLLGTGMKKLPEPSSERYAYLSLHFDSLVSRLKSLELLKKEDANRLSKDSEVTPQNPTSIRLPISPRSLADLGRIFFQRRAKSARGEEPVSQIPEYSSGSRSLGCSPRDKELHNPQ